MIDAMSENIGSILGSCGIIGVIGKGKDKKGVVIMIGGEIKEGSGIYTEVRQYKKIGKVSKRGIRSWGDYFKEWGVEVIGRYRYYYMRSEAGSVWYRLDEMGKEHWYVVGYEWKHGDRGGHSKVYFEISKGEAERLVEKSGV